MRHYLLSRAYFKLRGYPVQTTTERHLVLKHLQAIPTSGRILEWGIGRSTVYYLARLAQWKRYDVQWYGLEHHPEWITWVQQRVRRIPISASFICEPFRDPWTLPGCSLDHHACVEHYPHAEQQAIQHYTTRWAANGLGEKFDLIFIDGRFRARCLRVARTILSPEGIVLLFDAERPFYDSACAEWAYAKSIWSRNPFRGHQSKLWMGRLTPFHDEQRSVVQPHLSALR